MPNSAALVEGPSESPIKSIHSNRRQGERKDNIAATSKRVQTGFLPDSLPWRDRDFKSGGETPGKGNMA
jgi:hypothetical protein